MHLSYDKKGITISKNFVSFIFNIACHFSIFFVDFFNFFIIFFFFKTISSKNFKPYLFLKMYNWIKIPNEQKKNERMNDCARGTEIKF